MTITTETFVKAMEKLIEDLKNDHMEITNFKSDLIVVTNKTVVTFTVEGI